MPQRNDISGLGGRYPTPYPRSYWVIPGRLLVGVFPGGKDEGEACKKLQALFDTGIRCVVNLMEPDERDHAGAPFVDYVPLFEKIAAEHDQKISCLRFPVPDLGVPDIVTMRRILVAIDTAMSAGMPVYVHCWGGIGRTGTVVGCFLVRHGMSTGDTAVERIRHLRHTETERHRSAPETRTQVVFVESWRRHEFGHGK